VLLTCSYPKLPVIISFGDESGKADASHQRHFNIPFLNQFDNVGGSVRVGDDVMDVVEVANFAKAAFIELRGVGQNDNFPGGGHHLFKHALAREKAQAQAIISG
jgi:hypothetical protein